MNDETSDGTVTLTKSEANAVNEELKSSIYEIIGLIEDDLDHGYSMGPSQARCDRLLKIMKLMDKF